MDSVIIGKFINNMNFRKPVRPQLLSGVSGASASAEAYSPAGEQLPVLKERDTTPQCEHGYFCVVARLDSCSAVSSPTASPVQVYCAYAVIRHTWFPRGALAKFRINEVRRFVCCSGWPVELK